MAAFKRLKPVLIAVVGCDHYEGGTAFMDGQDESGVLKGLSMRFEDNNLFDPEAVAVYYSHTKTTDYGTKRVRTLVGHVSKSTLDMARGFINAHGSTKHRWELVDYRLTGDKLKWFEAKVRPVE